MFGREELWLRFFELRSWADDERDRVEDRLLKVCPDLPPAGG